MNQLQEAYKLRYDKVLKPLADAIEDQLRIYFEGEPRIDRITSRAKSVDSFLKKAQKKGPAPSYVEGEAFSILLKTNSS